MNRYKLPGVILVATALGLAVFGLAGSLAGHTAAGAPAAQTTTIPYLWNYSVKFVCGLSKGPVQGVDSGEAPVKAGNYATDINIHNYQYTAAALRIKVLVLADDWPTPVPLRIRDDQDVAGRAALVRPKLRPDGATMIDCHRLWKMAHPLLDMEPPTPMPLLMGYLVILSNWDLDVDAVYTAESPAVISSTTRQATGIGIDVERVSGKRVRCVPDADTSSPHICAEPAGSITPSGDAAPADMLDEARR
jgi:hypothetical protein